MSIVAGTSSPPPANPAPATPSAGRHHGRIARLGDLERRRRKTIVGVGALGVVMLMAASLALADYFLELPLAARAISWLAVMAVAAGVLWRLNRWTDFHAGDAATAAEDALPEMGQRLRTSYDYFQTPERVSPADPQLLSALEAEVDQKMTTRQVASLGRPWPVFALAGGAVVVVMVWLAALVAVPEWRISTGRLMLMPLVYSDVSFEPLPGYVDQGDDLAVRVRVDGRPLQTARVKYRNVGEEPWNEIPLAAVAAADEGLLIGDLTAVLADRQSDFEVRVEAGSYESGIVPIDVRIPLVLKEWVVNVQPPEYTGLPSSVGSPDGLRVPEGSTLELRARYNRAPRELILRDSGDDQPSAADVEINESIARFSIVVDDSPLDLSVHASTADGVTDDSSLFIDVVPDRQPRLTFALPEKEQTEAIPTAEMRFALDAEDDYGLSTVGIRYRIDDGDPRILWQASEEELAAALAKTVTLPLEDLELSYPQAITYYAFATDNRAGSSQETTSELRFLDVRPFSREYEIRESNCSGCQGECLSLEKLIKAQRQLLGRTFLITRRHDSDVDGDDLAQEQHDLRGKTESLAEALAEKIGPLPSLDRATESMAAAIEDLKADHFEDGQADEQTALAGLIAARRNLRNILKLSNAQSKMCRNVDQQQLDKLRKPERKAESKPESQQQKLAEINKQLRELAKQQQSFCQSAAACSKGAPSSSGKPSPSSASESSQAAESSSESGKDSPDQGEGENESEEPGQSPSREQLVDDQQQSADRAEAIKQQMADGRFGRLAPRRVAEAARAIGQSGQLFATGQNDADAIEQARRAAESLDQLAEHLGQRHQPDFADKLAAAKREAERLSQQQRQLSRAVAEAPAQDSQDASVPQAAADEDPADRQRQLARRGEELADLVDQVEVDMLDQPVEVQKTFSNQAATDLPRAASAPMQQASRQMEQGNPSSAAESGTRAADHLQRFASSLESVDQALGSALLEQMTRAEQQAAALLEDLERPGDAAPNARDQARAAELGQSIQAFASGDAELSRAAKSLDGSTTPQPFRAPREPNQADPPKSASLATAPTTLAEGVRKVDQILQRRIQDAILDGALQQSDGRVPPEYVDMVEAYYRTLSADVE